MPKITISRGSSPIGMAVTMSCWIDNTLVCKLKMNDSYEIEVPAGKYSFYCRLSMNPKSKIIELDLLANESVEVLTSQGAWEPNITVRYGSKVKSQVKSVTVLCSGCGANNVVVVGSVSECEYCGTPINA
jgi:hypothetical protein